MKNIDSPCSEKIPQISHCIIPRSTGNVYLSYQISLKNNRKCQRPVRHMSFIYDHREKYISHTNSYILKKISRPNIPEDQHMEFVRWNLPDSKNIYDDFHDESVKESSESPFFVKKLSFNEKCSAKELKSPFVLKLTRIDTTTNKNEEERNLLKLKKIISNEILDDEENNYLKQDKIEENKTGIEGRILNFLDKENIRWLENPEFLKKNISKPVKSIFKDGGNLLKRRKLGDLKVIMSSSCDDLTKIINITEQTDNL